MSDRFLIGAFGTSLLIHLGLLPVLAFLPQCKARCPTMIPIDLVDAPKIEEIKKPEITLQRQSHEPNAKDHSAEASVKTDDLRHADR